jgi:hypothetical protein
MRMLVAAAAIVPLICAPAPAAAQSFLENLARRSAERVAEAAAESAVSGAVAAAGRGQRDAGAGRADSDGRPAAQPAAAAAIARGPAPWPLNPGDASYTGDLEFDPADEARARGLHEFAKVRCTGCEGGYSFDSWITHHTDQTVDEVAARVGALGIGQTLTWRGIEAAGVLEVVSEAPVGDFACKQVRVVMTRGEATYETPGLYCFGKSHAYARAMWVHVL